MEKYNLSKMSDEEIQNLFECVDVDEYDQSGDEECRDDESMDEDDAPFMPTSVIQEAITTSLAEIVDELETETPVSEPGPSSKGENCNCLYRNSSLCFFYSCLQAIYINET